MKKMSAGKKVTMFLCVMLLLQQVKAQQFNVKDTAFIRVFSTLYKSAGNYFKEVKGSPIVSTMFKEPDTIGYRIKLLPQGVTDWKHLSLGINLELTAFFKLGAYSKDSTEVAQRFYNLIALIKEIDKSAFFEFDDSYSDTKIKEVRICSGSKGPCGEDDKWRISLYFHKMFDDEYNVSVNIESYPQ